LIKDHGFVHISTGNLFRKAVSEKTPLGIKLHDIIAKGLLVSDDITNEVIKQEILKLKMENKSVVLDGYPRTINQAEFLDDIATVDLILYLDVDEKLAIKRISGRRLCPKCGKSYNIYFGPPKVEGICDLDGAKLIIRKDDNEQSVKQRFDIYENSTKQLLKYYEAHQHFHHLNANVSISQTIPEVEQLIKT
jgi:adenylate kinase